MQQSLNPYFETGRNAILDILSDGQFHASSELSNFSLQYNARIKELRESGFNIVSIRNKGYGYILESKRDATVSGDIYI